MLGGMSVKAWMLKVPCGGWRICREFGSEVGVVVVMVDVWICLMRGGDRVEVEDSGDGGVRVVGEVGEDDEVDVLV